MKIYLKIKEKLERELQPKHLEIIDESHKHQGHSGWREGGETHFSLTVISEKFAGMNRIARHKLIHKILQDELAGGVHALSITALTLEEKRRN